MAWKIGDLVTLKSGGPVMTVNVSGPDALQAIWFTQGQELRSGSFALAAVQPAQPSGLGEARQEKPLTLL